MAMSAANSHKDTKATLLNVAEKLFLAKGYEQVRVRDITDKARVNVAAINYYFNSKDNLYRAVLRRRFRDIAQRRIDRITQIIDNAPSTPDPAEIIAAFVRSFFDDVTASAEHKRHLAMVYREMSPDAVAADLVASELATPINSCLREALMLTHPHIGKDHAAFCASSIIGQVLHFIFMRDILRSLISAETEAEFIEIIIQHITAFSLRGIGPGSGSQKLTV